MDIIKNIAFKYYYNCNIIENKNKINIQFSETKYSHLQPNQYYDMIEEIIYDNYIYNNYHTKLSYNNLELLYK
jgi:hypothetical protein